MDIGTPNQTNTIYIGVGQEETIGSQTRYKVINVNDLNDNDKFIVYSDGTLHASGVEIEGAITASSGSIGPLSISAIPQTLGIRIIQNSGDTFKLDENESVTPSSLSFTYSTSLEGSVTAVWYYGTTPQDMNPVPNGWISGDTVTLTYSTLIALQPSPFQGGLMYLKCVVNGTYDSQISIKLEKDGKSADAYSYNIESSKGYIINTNTVSGNTTQLTASFYKNGTVIPWTGHTITWQYKSEPIVEDEAVDETGWVTVDLDDNPLFSRVEIEPGVYEPDYIVNLDYLNINSIQIRFLVD